MSQRTDLPSFTDRGPILPAARRRKKAAWLIPRISMNRLEVISLGSVSTGMASLREGNDAYFALCPVTDRVGDGVFSSVGFLVLRSMTANPSTVWIILRQAG